MKPTRRIAQAGVIAAVYAALTILVLQLPGGLGWGPIQFRVSEALTVIAALTPAAIPGLAAGTAIANASLMTQVGPIALLDVSLGSLATLLGALWTWRFRERTKLALAGPVVANALIVPAYLPDTRQTREELAQYYQSVTRVDQGLGKLFEHLQQLEKWDNTIIIYISDNGIAFPGAKTTVYQPGLNLPLIVRNTNQSLAGSVADDLVNWADLTPTILDMAGVLPQAESRLDSIYAAGASKWDNTANQRFHGRSFKDVLQ